MKNRLLALSVITYTYNDHALAAGLLRSMAGWDVRPRETLVIDDGSQTPFVVPDEAPPTRLVRLEPNQGPARAKAVGLGAAQNRFLLSLDADIRLPPDWISRCLREAAKPEVGIVATPILTDAGSGLLAKYQQLRYGLMVNFSGNADVAPAGLWLLRREVWQRHGFHDYPHRLHEDVHFSQTLRRAGLARRILPGPAARQIRRLSRQTMVRRGWVWQGRQYLAAARQNPVDPVNAFLLAMQNRILRHHAANPAFLYYDCLYLAFALTSLLGEAGYFEAAASLPAVLADALPHPWAGALLRADLAGLGVAFEDGMPASPLVEAIRQGVCSILPGDAAGALESARPHLEAEDRREDWDVSFYDALATGEGAKASGEGQDGQAGARGMTLADVIPSA
ncbi:glycosyltransferase family 2 protein [Desulfovibrio sp. TomC]|uniref:glycosyltransferase family 2 protein n=1 Tax=Desulfovibrio sp. TomC TaxID=1562888 RepID=UPI000573301C|nr:glycosyltransferase family A protein [Desulfovibrio sp. TomC]KHK02308.1 putative glycosyl transferase [Desulfovibrio sp. TomC]